MDYSHLSEQEIATFAEAMVENKLGSIPKDKQEHIKECDTCNEEIIALVDVLEKKEVLVKKNDSNVDILSENKPTKNSTLYYTWMGIAASIIIGAVILLLLSEKSSSTSPRIADEKPFMEEILEPQDSIIEEEVIVDVPIKEELKIVIPEVVEKEELLAFVSNDELEKLSERHNVALRGDDIEIISPNVINANTESEINLQWVNTDKQDLIIELYNNKAELINEKASSDNIYIISPNLEEGLYYWKLINSDFDLIFCGKIIIKE